MMNFIKNLAAGFVAVSLFMGLIILYIDTIASPFSNGSDSLFSALIVGGFIAIDIAIRIEKRFKLFDKIENPNVCKIILLISAALLLYHFTYRYQYKVYKGNYPNQVQVVKIDRLTGESTVSRPKFEK